MENMNECLLGIAAIIRAIAHLVKVGRAGSRQTKRKRKNR